MAKRKHRGSAQTVEQCAVLAASYPNLKPVVSEDFANCIEIPGTKIFVTVGPGACSYADDDKVIRKLLKGTVESIADQVAELALAG